MSLKIIIPGANFAALGNPKVEDYVEGLPGAGLSALYLFESGTVGQAYAGPATDYSGNGRAAPLLTGSTAIKSVGGVTSALDQTRSDGFGIATPIGVSSKFTVFGVSRNLLAWDGVITNVYLMPWSMSGNWSAPAAPTLADGNKGNVNSAGKGGVLHINQQMGTGASNNAAELASLSWRANPNHAQPWSGVGTRPSMSAAGTAKNSWIAWALSFDSAYGYTMRALGGGHTVTDANDAAAFYAAHQANSSKHLFGAMSYISGKAIGEMAMAGVYDGVAKTGPEMDVLLASMKARLATRLGTIL